MTVNVLEKRSFFGTCKKLFVLMMTLSKDRSLTLFNLNCKSYNLFLNPGTTDASK